MNTRLVFVGTEHLVTIPVVWHCKSAGCALSSFLKAMPIIVILYLCCSTIVTKVAVLKSGGRISCFVMCVLRVGHLRCIFLFCAPFVAVSGCVNVGVRCG